MNKIVVSDTTSANYILSGKQYYTGAAMASITIPTFYKSVEYKCVYCGTVIKSRVGTCPNCGAPLSEAVEI